MSIKSFFAPVAKTGTKASGTKTALSALASETGIGAGSPSKRQRVESSAGDGSDDIIDVSNDTNEVASSSTPYSNTTTVTKITLSTTSVGWGPMDSLDDSWKSQLITEYGKPYFKTLMGFLNTEVKKHEVYPSSQNLFAAFNLCPYDKVKVVIIGQDPYHGPGQAHGLCFSVQKGVQIPPSLRNMFKEAMEDPDIDIKTPTHGNLEHWATQGVLLLNTVLTVRKSEANSHQKKGWETFTDAVVKQLSKKEGIVYLLWGKPAHTKCAGINASKNVIIQTSHPSPLGAYKTTAPFMTSRSFSRCNKALVANNQEPIDWSVI